MPGNSNGKESSGPDTSRYEEYLVLNRAFTAPAVHEAITSIELSLTGTPLRILDAGTGAGGALPALAVRAQESGAGCVTAIDLDPRAVTAARNYVDQQDRQNAVEVREGDLLQLAEQASEDGPPL
ncbi:class I SAM-dependent methyltransferase [Nesterenkonia haasae]|uniref:class I SAM-dependent methyltransferase n=1 Tax=Nesterenkonia haasae TaxID=2587813 RepID=UPI0013909433|nr:class I SAM-dependent methyltransferase [Nesterenkonia haasae]